ncbi:MULTISPECIES: hypothetical protein [unclassified Microcoleus]
MKNRRFSARNLRRNPVSALDVGAGLFGWGDPLRGQRLRAIVLFEIEFLE